MTSKNKTIVVIGATSAVAQEVSRIHCSDGNSFVLCARDSNKLSIIAADLKSRGASNVKEIIVDFSDSADYTTLVDRILKTTDTVDIWYFFYGDLPDQSACEQSIEEHRNSLHINLLSIVELLHPISNIIEQTGSGTVAVVSSVAGDRGRGSNYVYGTAKGALSLYLQGLRNRLHKKGGTVITIKPGFIISPMTAHLDTGGALWSSPEKIATDIVHAVERKRDVVYTPGYWRLIMLVIKLIPEKIFKRLSL